MKALKWLMPIAGLLSIGLGIAALFRPFSGLTTIAIFFGIGILSAGIAEIASYCGAEKEDRSGRMLVSGILSILFGLWATFGIGVYAIATILPFIFAGWVMISGVERIVEAVSRKSESDVDDSEASEKSINKRGVILGILTVIWGGILMFNPFMSARIVSIMLSILLIAYGVITIDRFFRAGKAKKQSKAEAKKQEKVSSTKEDKPKSKLKSMGKKALIIFILSWVVKIAILVVVALLIT